MGDAEKTARMVQNLRDAGCTQEETEAFLSALERGDRKTALCLLAAHRKELLEQFHKSRECIDCLDYLVLQMKKESEDSGGSGR